jgi:diamine N-acetyltransferase
MNKQNRAVVTRESIVSLREITKDAVRIICDLKVADRQQKFVAPNAVSIAQAYFSESAWFCAIYAGESAVGFLMLDKDPKSRNIFYGG